MKKSYIIMAVTVTALPLILAAAIKSVIPIVFWFFPVAAFLFISRGIRMNKKDGKEKTEYGKEKNGRQYNCGKESEKQEKR